MVNTSTGSRNMLLPASPLFFINGINNRKTSSAVIPIFPLTSTAPIPHITQEIGTCVGFLGLARSGNSHHKWPPL